MSGGGDSKEEKEKKEEKIPHMCEIIGHRPLWGRCPKREKRKRELLRHQRGFTVYPESLISTDVQSGKWVNWEVVPVFHYFCF